MEPLLSKAASKPRALTHRELVELLTFPDAGALFAAGGVATPADAALMMELGAEGVFVGSGIFKSGDPEKRAGNNISNPGC